MCAGAGCDAARIFDMQVRAIYDVWSGAGCDAARNYDMLRIRWCLMLDGKH